MLSPPNNDGHTIALIYVLHTIMFVCSYWLGLQTAHTNWYDWCALNTLIYCCILGEAKWLYQQLLYYVSHVTHNAISDYILSLLHTFCQLFFAICWFLRIQFFFPWTHSFDMGIKWHFSMSAVVRTKMIDLGIHSQKKYNCLMFIPATNSISFESEHCKVIW